jgi:hypothetical protein
VAQSVAQIEARLTTVRTAIDTVLAGGVASFSHEGGDQATLLDLGKLQQIEFGLLRQLGAARRAEQRFWPARILD